MNLAVVQFLSFTNIFKNGRIFLTFSRMTHVPQFQQSSITFLLGFSTFIYEKIVIRIQPTSTLGAKANFCHHISPDLSKKNFEFLVAFERRILQRIFGPLHSVTYIRTKIIGSDRINDCSGMASSSFRKQSDCILVNQPIEQIQILRFIQPPCYMDRIILLCQFLHQMCLFSMLDFVVLTFGDINQHALCV